MDNREEADSVDADSQLPSGSSSGLSRRQVMAMGAVGATGAALASGALAPSSAKASSGSAPAAAAATPGSSPVGDGDSGADLMSVAPYGYAGNLPPGPEYDRLRLLTSKLPRNGHIASGSNPGSTSITLSATPAGLQPNQPIMLAGGTAEMVYTSSNYAAGANPVTLASPIQQAGHSQVVYDVTSGSGPRATDMTPFGVLPVACVITEGPNGLYTMMLGAGADQGPPINTLMVSPSLVSGPAAQMDRQRSLGHAGDGLGVALVAAPPSTALAASTSGGPATVVVQQVPGQRHILTMLSGSYSAVPSGGRIQVLDGTTELLDLDVAAAGTLFVPLPVGGLAGTAGQKMTVTLSGGGAGVVGKLSVAKLTVG